MTCIGNSGPLPEPVSEAIEKGECTLCWSISIVVAAGMISFGIAVLSLLYRQELLQTST